jgi:hypothetical protein
MAGGKGHASKVSKPVKPQSRQLQPRLSTLLYIYCIYKISCVYIYPHRFDDRFKKIHVKKTILGAGRKKIILETWQQIQTTLSSTLSKKNGPLRNLVLHGRKESEQIA